MTEYLVPGTFASLWLAACQILRREITRSLMVSKAPMAEDPPDRLLGLSPLQKAKLRLSSLTHDDGVPRPWDFCKSSVGDMPDFSSRNRTCTLTVSKARKDLLSALFCTAYSVAGNMLMLLLKTCLSVYLELISFVNPVDAYLPGSPARLARENRMWAIKAPGWIDYAFLWNDSESVRISDGINSRAKEGGDDGLRAASKHHDPFPIILNTKQSLVASPFFLPQSPCVDLPKNYNGAMKCERRGGSQMRMARDIFTPTWSGTRIALTHGESGFRLSGLRTGGEQRHWHIFCSKWSVFIARERTVNVVRSAVSLLGS
ncbi:MAG: hypothetical protein NXY57DRAFT_966539 [Lentinula lateritia]|nr:MAG: hypothetical protein NXY57DRAFT_966539 [Lentinula lateritia]